jgi:hypothetical protein
MSYSLQTSTQRTWFTAQRMKRIGIGLVTVDLLLLLVWCAGSVYIAVYLAEGIACYTEAAIVHFFILIHFALAMFLTSMVCVIQQADAKAHRKHHAVPIYLPVQAYAMLTWIFTAIISTAGDGTLMTWGIIDLSNHPAGFDECNTARILHIFFDALALAVSVLTILWFIAFSVCTLKPKY